MSRYALYLTFENETRKAESDCLPALRAVCRAFEVQHSGDKEALASIFDMSLTPTQIYRWWGGEPFGPPAPNAAERLIRAQIASGRRVLVIGAQGRYVFNNRGA